MSRSPNPRPDPRPHRRRWTAGAAAASTVLAGMAALGFTGAPAATGADALSADCTFANGAITCSHTFTASTTFDTGQLPGWHDAAPLTFQVTGASGGDARWVGPNPGQTQDTAGGQGGTVTRTWTPPSDFHNYIGVALGHDGGDTSWSGGTHGVDSVSQPGSGGTGGGPGGAGAGGDGGNASVGLIYLGYAGAGGGGATGVYSSATSSTPPQTSADLIAEAPGGGGASGGEVNVTEGTAGNDINHGNGFAGGDAGVHGNGPGGICMGAAGGSGSGGEGGCRGWAAPGADGTATTGGSGGSASQALGAQPSSHDEGVHDTILGQVNGGGGGGGGVYGGGGGGVEYVDSTYYSPAGSGGGGGSTLPITGHGPQAQVVVSWQVPSASTTALNLSSDSLSTAVAHQGDAVAVTATTSPRAGAPVAYTGGQVSFTVDGQPAPLSSGGTQTAATPVTGTSNTASINIATAALSPGLHTVKAAFAAGLVQSSATATLDVLAEPAVHLGFTGTTGNVNGTPSVAQGSDVTARADVPGDASGTVTFSDAHGNVIPDVPVSGGQATAVFHTGNIPVGTDGIWADYQPDPGNQQYYANDSDTMPLLVTAPLGSAGTSWTFAKNGSAGTQLLEVNNNALTDGGKADTWQPVSTGTATQANEVWSYQPSSGNPGYGELVNQNSGRCLEVNGTSGGVDQWSCQDSAGNELWTEVANPTGGYSLKVRSSGQYLAATGAGAYSNGTVLAMQATQDTSTAWIAKLYQPLGPADASWSFAKTGASDTTQLLEVYGNASPNGTAVDTWEATGTPAANQVWAFKATVGNGTYGQLVNRSTGRCLEINASTGSVDQWDCVSGAANELWSVVTNPTGGLSLQVLSSGKYLGTTTANGAPVSSGNHTLLTVQDGQGTHTGWALISQ